MKKLFILAILIIAFSSCVTVNVTVTPEKVKQEVPADSVQSKESIWY